MPVQPSPIRPTVATAEVYAVLHDPGFEIDRVVGLKWDTIIPGHELLHELGIDHAPIVGIISFVIARRLSLASYAFA